jgi:hypothetical protein
MVSIAVAIRTVMTTCGQTEGPKAKKWGMIDMDEDLNIPLQKGVR